MRGIVVGLDFGTSNIKLVAAETAKDDGPPRVLIQIKRESRGLRRGYIVHFEEALNSLKETVREAERQIRVRIKSVFLGIGGATLESRLSEGQTVVARADLQVSEEDIRRALEASKSIANFQNRHLLHTIPLAFKLDGQKILGQPVGMVGHKLEFKTLLVHCLAQHLNDLTRLAGQAGLTVEDIIASPLAASLPTLTMTQKMAGCVLVNIGAQTTSLVVFEDGLPTWLQTISLGSNDVTHDIALGLRLPLEEAETAKVNGAETPAIRRKLDEIIEARLSDIFELVETQLKKIDRSGLLPAGAVLIGGGVNFPAVEKLAKNILRLPVKVFNPAAVPKLKNQIRNAEWAIAYGLCLIGLGPELEESFGVRIVRQTKNTLLRWLKEFLP